LLHLLKENFLKKKQSTMKDTEKFVILSGDKIFGTPVIYVPGSKSITNRSLLIAALSEGVSEIINPLHSEDSAVMLRCLSALGAEIKVDSSGNVMVAGRDLSVYLRKR
jgi:5-enolpyruvylshikimate-3-phosphate synthase